MIRSIITQLTAVALAAGAVWAATLYPANPVFLAAVMLTYAALLWWRPAAWLFAVPALLPLLDFAPWTGWFFLEEIDLLLLTTAAVGYWRLGDTHRAARMPVALAMLFLLLTLSYLISTGIGLGPNPMIDANSFSSYDSPFNSLREAKGFFWALALLPLLMRSLGPDAMNIRRYFIPGMLAGFLGVCVAAVWERTVFPGLLNFSSDYRITAPFSAMHTGGAALDGYLALTLPFLAAWMFDEKSQLKTWVAIGLMAVGTYVVMSTFSRGVYVAYAWTIALFIGLACRRVIRQGNFSWRQAGIGAVLLACIVFAMHGVFVTGGYRALAAAIILLGAAFLVGGVQYRLGSNVPPIAIAVLLGLSCTWLAIDGATATPGSTQKLPYMVFALSVLLFGGGVAAIAFGPARLVPTATLIVGVAFFWMAENTILVAWHWGGTDTLPAIALWVVLAVGLVLANRTMQLRLWRVNDTSIRYLLFCGIACAVTIPIISGYFMTARFSTTKEDLAGRWSHWQEAVVMMKPGLLTDTFGMGLGRYPETYRFNNTQKEIASSYAYSVEAGNIFLKLGGPHYAIGYGEVIRMLQHVAIEPAKNYVFSVNVRTSNKAVLDAQICKRLLLYAENCIGLNFGASPADGKWHRLRATINSGTLGSGSWFARAPTQLQLSIGGDQSQIDIDQVSLVDPLSGVELIGNGSFSAANDRWFFSSDHHHLPWHVKNFATNIFFEMGAFGVVVFLLTLGYATIRLVKAALLDNRLAEIALASIGGFLLVGLFDSLLDVPRLTLLFFLVITVSTARPVKRLACHKTAPHQADAEATQRPSV